MAFLDSHDGQLGDLVPAIFAAAIDEANRYRQILEDHGISAVVDEDYDGEPPAATDGTPSGVAVLVDERTLDDAKGVIAEIDEMDELESLATTDEVDDDDDDEEEFDLEYDPEADAADTIGDEDDDH